jgi:hypothetical protein
MLFCVLRGSALKFCFPFASSASTLSFLLCSNYHPNSLEPYPRIGDDVRPLSYLFPHAANPLSSHVRYATSVFRRYAVATGPSNISNADREHGCADRLFDECQEVAVTDAQRLTEVRFRQASQHDVEQDRNQRIPELDEKIADHAAPEHEPDVAQPLVALYPPAAAFFTIQTKNGITAMFMIAN